MNPSAPGFDPTKMLPATRQTRNGLHIPASHAHLAMPPTQALPGELYGQKPLEDFTPNGKTILACALTPVNLKLSDVIEISEQAAQSMGANTIEARVLNIGPKCEWLKVGNRILVHAGVGTGVAVRGKLYKIIREEDVVGRFDE